MEKAIMRKRCGTREKKDSASDDHKERDRPMVPCNYEYPPVGDSAAPSRSEATRSRVDRDEKDHEIAFLVTR